MLLEGQRSYRPQVKLKSSCQLLVMSSVRDFTAFAQYASSSAHILPVELAFYSRIAAGSHKVLK